MKYFRNIKAGLLIVTVLLAVMFTSCQQAEKETGNSIMSETEEAGSSSVTETENMETEDAETAATGREEIPDTGEEESSEDRTAAKDDPEDSTEDSTTDPEGTEEMITTKETEEAGPRTRLVLKVKEGTTREEMEELVEKYELTTVYDLLKTQLYIVKANKELNAKEKSVLLRKLNEEDLIISAEEDPVNELH